jgi:hypothetical protein
MFRRFMIVCWVLFTLLALAGISGNFTASGHVS